MTKSLTEQWKDGELEEGYYYIIVKDMDGIIIDSFDTWYHVKGNTVKQFSYVDIKEVLEPVPTYEDFLIHRDYCRDHQKLLVENMKLKERLKEAEYILDEMGWADRGLIDDYFKKWGRKLVGYKMKPTERKKNDKFKIQV